MDSITQQPQTNGHGNGHVSAQQVEDLLTQPISLGYKSRPNFSYFWDEEGTTPVFEVVRYIEAMLPHPVVRNALCFYKGGIADAEFKVTKASSPRVAYAAHDQLSRFYKTSRSIVQSAYDYGWGAFEPVYTTERGYLSFDYLLSFHPRDCYALTRNSELVGVRVKNVTQSGAQGHRDLWAASKSAGYWMPIPGSDPMQYIWVKNEELDLPAKGFWYAHQPRYEKHYGTTQLYGAYRPWARLARRDGAEEILDGGVYRFCYCGPTLYYPPQGFRTKSGSPDPRDGRDLAREYVENAKTGVGNAFPSVYDQNGHRLWELVWPTQTLDISHLLQYTGELEKLIIKGVGIPPELLEASEVGSGWSGRAIPMEGYLAAQQENVDAIVKAWRDQIGLPLIRFNFGPDAWFEIEAESLLKSKTQARQGQEPGKQGQGNGQPPEDGQQPQGAGPSAPPQPGSAGQIQAPPQAAHFALPREDKAKPTQSRWEAYHGPGGGVGWWNTETGEIRYQEHSPEGRQSAEKLGSRQPGPAKPQPEQKQQADTPTSFSEKAQGMLAKAKHVCMVRFQQLEDRYGRRGALAVAGAMLAMTPVPLPGTSLAPIAIAEVVRYLHGRLKSRAVAFATGQEGRVSWQELATEGQRILEEVYRVTGEEPPSIPVEQWIKALREADQGGEKGSAYFATDAGHWITIGGQKGADGKRHGGSPVMLKDGRIVKGHPGLVGKKIDALKEPEEKKEGPKEPHEMTKEEFETKHQFSQAIWDELRKKTEYVSKIMPDRVITTMPSTAKPGYIRVGEWDRHGPAGHEDVPEDELDDWLSKNAYKRGYKRIVVEGGIGNTLPSKSYAGVGFKPDTTAAKGVKSFVGPEEGIEWMSGRLASGGYKHRVEDVPENLPEKAGVKMNKGEEKFPGHVYHVAEALRAGKHVPAEVLKDYPDLKSPDADPSTHRQQLTQSKDYARAVWGKKARQQGIPSKHLHQLAGELLAHDQEFKKDRTRLLQDARKLSTSLGYGDIRNLKQRNAAGKIDSNAVKGLDDVAARLAEQYPEQFPDPDAAADRLFDLLAEGNPEAMPEDEAYQQAFDHLEEMKGREKERSEEPIPFSLPFDEEKHPRDESGQFVEKSTPAHHMASLKGIAEGEKGYVSGWPVRRTASDKWRMETDRYHVEGTAEEVAERIAREWKDQQPDQARIDAALSRAQAWHEPDYFGDQERVERETKAFEDLPKGTRVVSLEADTYGRLGSIVHKTEDGKTVKAVKLDGSPEPVGNYVEPLDEKLSWRIEHEEEEAVTQSPTQGFLFAVHAPAGGIHIAGTRYEGGQFIPEEALSSGTPEEREHLSRQVAHAVIHEPGYYERLKEANRKKADEPKPEEKAPEPEPPAKKKKKLPRAVKAKLRAVRSRAEKHAMQIYESWQAAGLTGSERPDDPETDQLVDAVFGGQPIREQLRSLLTLAQRVARLGAKVSTDSPPESEEPAERKEMLGHLRTVGTEALRMRKLLDQIDSEYHGVRLGVDIQSVLGTVTLGGTVKATKDLEPTLNEGNLKSIRRAYESLRQEHGDKFEEHIKKLLDEEKDPKRLAAYRMMHEWYGDYRAGELAATKAIEEAVQPETASDPVRQALVDMTDKLSQVLDRPVSIPESPRRVITREVKRDAKGMIVKIIEVEGPDGTSR